MSLPLPSMGLDIFRAVRIYLAITQPFRRSDSLFVIPEGPRKRLSSSKDTIGNWIRSAISEAYRCWVDILSSELVGAYWVVQHQAPASQVCKAATQASGHTFFKF